MRVTVTPDQIRTAFEAVKDDPSFDESRGLWERGKPPVEMLQAMSLRPEILRGFGGLGAGLYPGGLVERRIKELVIITSSNLNECQFCENAHCDIVEIEDIVDRPLERIADPAGLPARERLAVQYTRAVITDSNHLPDELMAEIHEHFSDPELHPKAAWADNIWFARAGSPDIMAHPAEAELQYQRLHHLPADRQDRVERRHGILEHHRNPTPADRLHLAIDQRPEIARTKADLAGRDTRRVGQQAHQRHRRHALAAARLAHDAQGPTGPHVEAHAAYGFEGAAPRVEGDGQIPH